MNPYAPPRVDDLPPTGRFRDADTLCDLALAVLLLSAAGSVCTAVGAFGSLLKSAASAYAFPRRLFETPPFFGVVIGGSTMLMLPGVLSAFLVRLSHNARALGIGAEQVTPTRVLMQTAVPPFLLWKVPVALRELAEGTDATPLPAARLSWWWLWLTAALGQSIALADVDAFRWSTWFDSWVLVGSTAAFVPAVLTFRLVWNLNREYRARAGLTASSRI